MNQPTDTAPRQLDPMSVRLWLQRLARADQAPWLHAEVARRMAERLPLMRARPRTLLDWWGFAGAGQRLLARAYPRALRLVVEPTAALRRRSAAPWWSLRRRHERVLAPDQVASASVQLVWANMMLHASLDPAALFARWHQALAVDGFVMFSCLGPDTLRELRELYRRLGWPAPMAELVDMHDLGDMLLRAGFADPVMDQEVLDLSWASPQALLAELRGLGINAAPGRFAGLRTARWRARLLAELSTLAGADGRIHLRFEVAYGHAFKVAPRSPDGGETIVSLDDMRTLLRQRPSSR